MKKPSLLAERLARVLYEAGRTRASGIARRNGPMISFAQWVQRQLDAEKNTPKKSKSS